MVACGMYFDSRISSDRSPLIDYSLFSWSSDFHPNLLQRAKIQLKIRSDPFQSWCGFMRCHATLKYCSIDHCLTFAVSSYDRLIIILDSSEWTRIWSWLDLDSFQHVVHSWYAIRLSCAIRSIIMHKVISWQIKHNQEKANLSYPTNNLGIWTRSPEYKLSP